MNQFLLGAIAFGYWTAGLFFWRFWTKTRDRLFAIFAVAFWILGLLRCIVALTPDAVEHYHYLYWVRLLAYCLILLAILDKNRSARRQA